MVSSSFTKSGRLRRQLRIAFKLVIALALLYALFHYRLITIGALQTTFRNPLASVSALGLIFIAYALNAIRWLLVLHAMGISVGLRACFEIFAMGAFANTFLPGGTGGDLVRALYIARHVHRDRSGGVVSVATDRAFGLIGAIIVAVVLGLSGPHVIDSPVTRTFFHTLVVALVISIATAVLTMALVNQSRFFAVSGWIGTRTIAQRSFLRLLEAAVQMRGSPVVLIASGATSVLIMLLIAGAVILLSQGFEAGGLQPIDFANATVISLLTNAIPITPGGVGVAEGAFAVLCYAWETTPTALAYGSIFFSYRLLLAIISLLGSVAFVTYKRPDPAAGDRARSGPDISWHL
jgi:uncharacterized protein (TIRG00374 family)